MINIQNKFHTLRRLSHHQIQGNWIAKNHFNLRFARIENRNPFPRRNFQINFSRFSFHPIEELNQLINRHHVHRMFPRWNPFIFLRSHFQFTLERDEREDVDSLFSWKLIIKSEIFCSTSPGAAALSSSNRASCLWGNFFNSNENINQKMQEIYLIFYDLLWRLPNCTRDFKEK